MADDKKNLYKLVTQANKDNPDGAKSRFGYTVDGAYKGSVSILESAYYDIKTVQVAGGSVAPAGTFNTSSGLQASEQYSVMSNADGLAIKIEAGSKWTTQYQGLCLVRDYMSFYVSVKDESKYAHVPIGYQNVKINDYYGQSLAGKYSFPSYEAGETKNNKYDRDNYIVGVGLDFDNFVIPYLKKFFNEDGGKWEVNTLRKIGGNLQMFAEILFPKTDLEEEQGEFKATNYYVIHSPVTLDYHVPAFMGFFILHFPVPLFLVSDFSALGTVNVKKQQKLLKVGGGQIEAPFGSGKYKHKEAKIDGFKYSQYSEVGDTVLKQTKIDHIGGARCFVRIFFDRAAQSELGLSSSLSEQQKKNLFTGAYDANQFIARRVIDSGSISTIAGASLSAYMENVAQLLGTGLTGNQILLAFKTIGLWEGGGMEAWNFWGIVGEATHGRAGKDEAGYNAGLLSFTEVSKGISKFWDTIKTNIPQDYANMKQFDAARARAKRAKKGVYTLLSTDGDVFQRVYEAYTDIVQKSTIQTFIEKYYGQFAIPTIKQSGFTSPLGVAVCFAHTNWKPAYVQGDYREVNIAGEPDQVRKIKLAGAAFIRRAYRQYGSKNPPNADDIIKAIEAENPSIHPKYHKNEYHNFICNTGKKYGGWYVRSAKVIMFANDINLSNPQQFSYS